MADNYSSGTIQTNFRSFQVKMFQEKAFVYHSLDNGEFETESEALKFFHDPELLYDPAIFDEDGSDFWEMETFNYEAAINAMYEVFGQYPNEELEVKIDVAFHCSKPRMGEFGGINEIWQNEKGIAKCQ